jgi:hypothetical protein
MALPTGVSVCGVDVSNMSDFYGHYAPVSSVKVTPKWGGTSAVLVWAAEGIAFGPFTETLNMNSDAMDGSGFGAEVSDTIYLPHVDQPGFVDTSGRPITFWTYEIALTSVINGQSATVIKRIQPVVGQSLIDLDLVPDSSSANTIVGTVPIVTSVNGQTGNVVVSGDGGTPGPQVDSINGQIGALTINGLAALAPKVFGIPVTSVNGATGDVTVAVPVTSVNGHIGAVVVDVPVKSVNGLVGDVVIPAAGGTLATAPAGSTFTVFWTGSHWEYPVGTTITSRPSPRGDITFQFVDPYGTAPVPTFSAPGVDLLVQAAL